MIDILIIGAGPTGLCVAKTFLEYDGKLDVVLVDAHATVGGVWSKEQLYPTLKTNNLWGTLDFSDFPMDERFGIGPEQHVTGDAMHAYLTAYAERFGVLHRIRFNTRVVEVRRQESGAGWSVKVDPATGNGEVLEAKRLVVATGVLSVPHMPDLKGIEAFNAPYLHSSELGPRGTSITCDPEVQTVAVIGGSKSSYDAVYLAASTGHKVEWIIRKSGRGPTWVFPSHTFLGPFRAFRERLVTRRIVSFMAPTIFPDFSGFGWLKSFLHFTSIGKTIAKKFWGAIHADTLRDCGFKVDPKLNILEPEQSPFWYGTASGVLNYDKDIFDFVRNGQVRIHRADIESVSDHCIHLSDGTDLQVDALVASTGFSAKPTIAFEPTTSHSDLGVPTTKYNQQQASFWAEQDTTADLSIASEYPRLVTGPYKAPGSSLLMLFHAGMNADIKYTPWRLYKGIAPPGLTAAGDRSLVFLGMFSNIANTIRLEIQCLWAVAYFNGKLPNVDRDIAGKKVFEQTALFQRYTQHRAPYGHGRFYPDLVFEQVPYWDVLLNDLGLRTARKANRFRELFEPYSQADYRGLMKEWRGKAGL